MAEPDVKEEEIVENEVAEVSTRKLTIKSNRTKM